MNELTGFEKDFLQDRLERISRAGYSISTLNDVLTEIGMHEDGGTELLHLAGGAKYSIQNAMGLLGGVIHRDSVSIAKRLGLDGPAYKYTPRLQKWPGKNNHK